MSDEKEEKDTQSETSTDETTSETVTEDDKKTDELMIPKTRFDEVNAKLKEAEAKLTEKPVAKPQEANKVESKSDMEDRLIAVEFMAKHKEFDAEDYDAANSLAKGKGVTLDEVVSDPIFTAWQEKKLSEKKVEEATPTTGRSPKHAPDKPLSEMSKEEHMDHFKKVVNG